MFTHNTLLSLLAATTALATPAPAREAKPPFFILAGDSTTAPIQPWKGTTAPGGGGWGDGLLKSLENGAAGVNLGHNGQTTVSYRENGYWKNLLSKIGDNNDKHDIYVTLAFGHNDQKEKSGISVAQYEANLEKMAEELKKLKANVIFVTPLTRRQFNSAGFLTANLDEQGLKTKAAATATKSAVIDLLGASKKYVQAIGKAEAWKFNADVREPKDVATSKDTTHLNHNGTVVFGRIVADLITVQVPTIAKYIKKEEKLTALIAAGKVATAEIPKADKKDKDDKKDDKKDAGKGDKPTTEKPETKKPTGEKAPTKKPAEEKPTN
ncbi:SGNH hydrolase [Venturia nashicola]|uniref:SGNH hydrolase n=1 Tax=Venturia nashicola TaxID=86259 RepID=A0A4Z1P3U0_9PEZI|nr:SGNH hydrolase [Venturia nashicola]TLD36165.1 SGNH hydrolase [Venturia nashicola]